jgi:hypothetical protein
LLFAEITQRWTVLPHALEDDLSASISSCCGLVQDYPAMLVQSNQSCVPCIVSSQISRGSAIALAPVHLNMAEPTRAE